MKQGIKRFAVALLAMALLCGSMLVALTGCGVSGTKLEETTELELYIDKTLYEGFMRDFIINFNKENPNLKLKTTTVSSHTKQETLESLRVELMAGKGPDVFVLRQDGNWFYPATPFNDLDKTMQAGTFADLAPIMQAAGISEEDLVQPVLEAGQIDGRQYILPLSYKVEGFMMHENMVEAMTQAATLGEQFRILQSVARPDLWNDQSYHMAGLPNFARMLVACGVDLDGGRIDIDEELLAEIFAYENDLMRAQSESYNGSYGFEAEEWVKYAQDPEYMYNISAMDGPLAATQFGLPIVHQFVPMYTQQGEVAATYDVYFAVRANSENKLNAAYLLQALLTKEGQEGILTVYESGATELINTTACAFPILKGCIENAMANNIGYAGYSVPSDDIMARYYAIENEVTTATLGVPTEVNDLIFENMYRDAESTKTPQNIVADIMDFYSKYLYE